MPELPEAETIARGLNTILPGRAVREVEVLRADVVRGCPHAFAGAVAGRGVREVGRRGKNVVFTLDDSSRIVVNLGMTGRIMTGAEDGPDPRSTHPAVVFHLEGGGRMTYDDVRRFGLLTAVPATQWTGWSRQLGPEPLARSFTAARLRRILARSGSPVRSLLLDQRKIAGVGNIYAVEALWFARVHPRTPANEIDAASAARLHRALRRVLRDAIRAGGTTLRDYRDANGNEGRFGRALRAYGRDGEPCTRCRTQIERIVFGGRSAFRCPRCQHGSHLP
ncbi:MAG: bifunctional DNA-formamidopyrimidine glycosylase/DNA-(apurinic or apyrimidinic site) lyase [Gemmatimonadota bacterium]|nr:bifunctional DNA-formamidopyrimidine glycosylase/DNA-(apurinic or apyrimidinic site) lyase [Gemmatimonadota bacterium]MDE2871493.1 bifunctional DNA-formamidopyrimidine glycosylase/DNA-(apurinic or apyrimidinic site) lyase [Gemmatimonadota bacterium]